MRSSVEQPTEHTITLTQPLASEHAEELRRRIYFLDERIVAFDLVSDAATVRVLCVRTDVPVETAELARKVNQIIATELRPLPPTDVRWHSARRDAVEPVFDELLARGLVHVAGEGQVVLAGPVIRLFDRIDALLRDIAVTEFGAVEYRYPSLIPTATLRRSGYLVGFPQHVMFSSRLRSDIDVYRDFVRSVETTDDLDAELLSRSERVDYCLPPTMCYHTFQQFRQRTIDGPTIVTSRGPSFRFEGRYHANLERLWDFTIREMVFIGSRQSAWGFRDGFLGRATALLDELDLVGHCEAAHDPFFGNEVAAENISVQRNLTLKHEVRLAVAPGRTIAVGSFNAHDRRFGTAFDIRLPDGKRAHSACVGFGLERLTYAVLCQHGVDERDWPDPLRCRAR